MAIAKEIVRSIIREGQEMLASVDLYDRPYEFEPHGRYVLVGVRQSGKSYMLYKRVRQLMAEGHHLEEFLYIDFDDERLLEMTADDFDVILQTYKSIFPHKPIILFDEVQNIDGWEHFARCMANQKYLTFISGSNAKMLSRDIHTTLGNRYFDEVIFPYSFVEYLGAQGIVLNKEWACGSIRFMVEQQFKKYLQWGGFPELLLFNNKRRWLNDVYQKILLNDIILRNNIKNEMALRLSFKRLAESVTKPIAYNRIANLVKGTGVATTATSVMQYAEYAKEAYMLIALSNYASKCVEKETIKKHYFIDNGLLSVFLTGTTSPFLENVCAIHLYRKYREELYFYNRNIEVDFIIPDEKYAIQACTTLTDEDTKKREVEALVKLDKTEDFKRMVIVTLDEEDAITVSNGKTIEVMPAWKWLLEEYL